MARIAASRSARHDDVDTAEAPWLTAGEPLPAGWHPGLPPPEPKERRYRLAEQPAGSADRSRALLMVGALALALFGAVTAAWVRAPADPIPLRPPATAAGDPALELDARVEILARQAAALEAERAALAAEVRALEARRDAAAAAAVRAAGTAPPRPAQQAGPSRLDRASAPRIVQAMPEVLVAREPALPASASPAPPASASPVTPVSATAVTPVSATTAATAGPRVFIHAPPSARSIGRELASRLTEEGWRIADVRPIRGSVSRTTVRYFFDTDREAASRLLGVIRGATAAAADAPQAFTTYRPLPSSGTLEVWLSGRS